MIWIFLTLAIFGLLWIATNALLSWLVPEKTR